MMKARLVLMTEENNEYLVRLRLEQFLTALNNSHLAQLYGFAVVKRDVEEWSDE